MARALHTVPGMRPAAKCRAEKAAHPDRFCSERACLWRVLHRDGRATPCVRHPVGPDAVVVTRMLHTVHIFDVGPGFFVLIARDADDPTGAAYDAVTRHVPDPPEGTEYWTLPYGGRLARRVDCTGLGLIRLQRALDAVGAHVRVVIP